jgi:hypothetical protein
MPICGQAKYVQANEKFSNMCGQEFFNRHCKGKLKFGKLGREEEAKGEPEDWRMRPSLISDLVVAILNHIKNAFAHGVFLSCLTSQIKLKNNISFPNYD